MKHCHVPDCGGCSCHICAPCGHCVEHEVIDETPDPISKLEADIKSVGEELARLEEKYGTQQVQNGSPVS